MLSPVAPVNFHFQCVRGCDRSPSIGDIEALVKREGYGLVIVDSLYKTGWLEDENSNTLVSRDLSRLQRLTRDTNCSLIVVDHTAKGFTSERAAVDSARGASAKSGFFDASFVLRPTDKGTDPQLQRAIDEINKRIASAPKPPAQPAYEKRTP